jgi:hypothetical protein
VTARHEEPATVEQLAAAMDALGFYSGSNDPREHAPEALRLGGADAYRLRLVNALLGAVQTEAILAETIEVDGERRAAAYRQQLVTAGVEEDPDKLMEFLRWQVLRATAPLREIARRPEAGPIPLAAAHAAEGLQWLLAVVAGGQQPPTAADVDALVHDLEAARSSLLDAVANVDVLRRKLAPADGLVGER